MVALSVIILTIGLIVTKLTNPQLDTRAGSELLGNIVTTVVGALVGFIGGRAAGRVEGAASANGREAPRITT